ncbi:MAG TPA: DMT family transporter [Galbitalea sp.]
MLIVVVLALGAAAVYGASDFFGGFAARRIHLVTATLFNYAVATLVILPGLLLVGGAWSSGAMWSGVVCGALAVFGLLAFYGVLAIGPMSLLSPLIALIQSIVPVAVAAATGQGLSVLGWIAIGIGIVAILLLAPAPRRGQEHISLRGGLLAVASGLLLGASLIVLDLAPKNSGIVPALWEIVTGTGILALAWLVLRTLGTRGPTLSFLQPSAEAVRTLSNRRAWLAAAGSGILVAFADTFIVIALHLGNLAVVSVLTSLYPVVTVILAATLLKERMTRLQFVAVGLVIAASLLFSAS